MKRSASALAVVGIVLLALACGGEGEAPAASPTARPPAEAPEVGAAEAESGAIAAAAPDPAELVARGKAVYGQACIACHAMDPSRAGAIGPAIAGSSLELLRAKVLRNEYPPGYTPKRDTGNMVPLPHLEKDLPALAAYLQSVEEG